MNAHVITYLLHQVQICPRLTFDDLHYLYCMTIRERLAGNYERIVQYNLQQDIPMDGPQSP